MKPESFLSHLYLCRYTVLLWMAVGLMACTDDAAGGSAEPASERVSVTLQLSSRANFVAPAHEANENIIRTLRVYAFRNNRVEGYAYAANLNASQHTLTLSVPSDNITFYLIANEAEAGALKVDNRADFGPFPEPSIQADGTPNYHSVTLIPDELKALTFRKRPVAVPDPNNPPGKDETGKQYTAPYLPMAAVHTARVSDHMTLNIGLERSVAKLSLYFSKTGQGELYMGRGLYLYNVPQYGYLFPKSAAELTQATQGSTDFLTRKESDTRPDPVPPGEEAYYTDSPIHQLNGETLLNCGWPEEPPGYDPTTDGHPAGLDINAVTEYINDPTKPDVHSYNQFPNRAFYLFANPYEATNDAQHQQKPEAAQSGYYLKILGHEHLRSVDLETGQETVRYLRERFYLSLKQVNANTHVRVYSIFSLDGYVTLSPNWEVQEWSEGGGDITFN